METNEVRGLLPLLADGELDAGQAVEVEAVLATRPDLQAELDRWRALRQAAHRGLTAETVPAALQARLAATVQRERNRSRILRLVGPLSAVAAVVVFALVLQQGLFSTDRVGGGATFAGQLVADQFVRVHEHCAVSRKHDPFGVVGQADAAALIADASDCKLNVPLTVPELRGFAVRGCCGCLDRSKQIKAIHVYYEEDAPNQAVVSLFVTDGVVKIACDKARSDRVNGRSYQVIELHGTGLVKWDEKLRSYTMVARLNPQQLEQLANQIRVAGWLCSQPPMAMATSRK